MANEAVKRYAESAAGDVVQDYTCADGTGITKGTVLTLTDPRTVIAVSAVNQPCAGIAARDKIASDGRTQISVHKQGYFDMVASGAISVGAAVTATLPANQVRAATSAASGAAIIGYAEETASDGETFLVRLNL